MRVKGTFIISLSNPDRESYHPEGDWNIVLQSHSPEDSEVKVTSEQGIEALPPTGDYPYGPGSVYGPGRIGFQSASGKTGGDLRILRRLDRATFLVEGNVWGASHTGWQEPGWFAPCTANVHLAAVGRQEYAGSHPDFQGQEVIGDFGSRMQEAIGG